MVSVVLRGQDEAKRGRARGARRGEVGEGSFGGGRQGMTTEDGDVCGHER